MIEDRLRDALTFDDVLLVPGYADFLPADADVRTRLTRDLRLNIPILSSAMDTVTEWRAAVTMAREGGLGIVHKNLTPEQQGREVAKVKRAESGMILDPITIAPDTTLMQALDIMRSHEISGLPVVSEGRPVGILTSRDIRFEQNLSQPVEQLRDRLPRRRHDLEEAQGRVDRVDQVLVEGRVLLAEDRAVGLGRGGLARRLRQLRSVAPVRDLAF